MEQAVKLEITIKGFSTTTLYQCKNCGWKPASEFDINPQTHSLFTRCNACRARCLQRQEKSRNHA